MNQMQPKRRNKRRAMVLLIAVAAVLLAGACVLVALWQRPSDGAYVPPPRDALAQPVGELEGNSSTLRTEFYQVALNPDLQVDAAGRCAIQFKNDITNQCDLMLDIRLKDSGLLIYRTGRVAPGEGIADITFVPDAIAAMVPGEQPVQLTVYSFALETYVNMGDIGLGTVLTYTP